MKNYLLVGLGLEGLWAAGIASLFGSKLMAEDVAGAGLYLLHWCFMIVFRYCIT